MTKADLIKQISLQVFTEAAGTAIAAGNITSGAVTFQALVGQSIIAAEVLCAGWAKWLATAPADEQSFLFANEDPPVVNAPPGMPNPVTIPPVVKVQ